MGERSAGRTILFVGMAVIAVGGMLEGLLHGLCLVSDRIDNLLSPNLGSQIHLDVPDERLRSRPNPEHPDHDRWGFRNASLPDRATIVAMGDSQTYGMGVRRDEAWPQQLEKLSGHRTYNLAFGGYGPTQSLLLFEEALSLQPRLIIAAFYSGNDLFDCYATLYDRGQLKELRSSDQATLEVIDQWEAKEPLAETVERAFEGFRAPQRGVLRLLLSQYSRTYGLIRAAVLAWPRAPEWGSIRDRAESSGGEQLAFEVGELRTVLQPKYRLLGLNLDDPRIREGHRVALAALEAMDRRARDTEVRFLVLLIPTKELVFYELAERDGDQLNDAYRVLTQNEQQMWRETRGYLRDRGIPFADLLPALRASLDRGDQPYPITMDGHLDATGQRVAAELVRDYLLEQGTLQVPRAK